VYVVIGFGVGLDSPMSRNGSSKGPHPHWWWCESWRRSLPHHGSGKNRSAIVCHSPKMDLKRRKGSVKPAPLQCLTRGDVSKQQSKQTNKDAPSNPIASKTAAVEGGAWRLNGVQAVGVGGSCRWRCTLKCSKLYVHGVKRQVNEWGVGQKSRQDRVSKKRKEKRM
jgi:hypothetical protein